MEYPVGVDRANQSTTPAEAFKRAVSLIGSQTAAGALIGITQPAISKILAAGKWCPHEHGAVLKVEAETGISRHALRPDLYPDESGHDAATADRRRPAPDAAFEPTR